MPASSGASAHTPSQRFIMIIMQELLHGVKFCFIVSLARGQNLKLVKLFFVFKLVNTQIFLVLLVRLILSAIRCQSSDGPSRSW